MQPAVNVAFKYYQVSSEKVQNMSINLVVGKEYVECLFFPKKLETTFLRLIYK